MLSFAAVLSACETAAATDIQLDIIDIPDALRADLELAAQAWEGCLVSDVPIRVRVKGIERGPTGYAYQDQVRNLDHLPVKDAWYPTALSNAQAGRRLNDGYDIDVFLQGDYYLEAREAGEMDVVTTMIHELGHGLGVSTSLFTPWQGEPLTSMGRPNANLDFFDWSFELHALDGTPNLYDTFLAIADGRRVTEFANPSLEMTQAIANPTLHFTGKAATAANGGFPVALVPMGASHRPDASRGPAPIMANNSGRIADDADPPRRVPDPVLLGMMEDLGWTVTESCKADAAR